MGWVFLEICRAGQLQHVADQFGHILLSGALERFFEFGIGPGGIRGDAKDHHQDLARNAFGQLLEDVQRCVAGDIAH
ncbi:hypothetical protein SDC9_164722 [bioreactor metagenome]|uniref:Uncharacterized protein n=1 Tax=bioreactor metagenome TaxID=1076179 RepID=A0A645FV17_9ZZZZ